MDHLSLKNGNFCSKCNDYAFIMLRFGGRFLLTLGLALWLGSLVFFAIGVAPVNFGTAQEWNLTGTNPNMTDQPVHWRTIGGEFTGRSIQKLNMVEWIGFASGLFGIILLLLHRATTNRKRQFGLMLVMGGILIVYSGILGPRLHEIRNTVPLDFSDQSSTKATAIHQEFDRKHEWYSRLTTVNALLLLVQVAMFSALGRREQR
jgi:drug/metabolite transporter (DMT)-like permease